MPKILRASTSTLKQLGGTHGSFSLSALKMLFLKFIHFLIEVFGEGCSHKHVTSEIFLYRRAVLERVWW